MTPSLYVGGCLLLDSYHQTAAVLGCVPPHFAGYHFSLFASLVSTFSGVATAQAKKVANNATRTPGQIENLRLVPSVLPDKMSKL